MEKRDFSAVLSAIKESPGTRAAHQEILHAVISAIAANDMGALEKHFTEDAQLHIHGFPEIDGSWTGRGDVIAAATRNYQKLGQQTARIEMMVEEGDNVVWRVAESGQVKDTGRRYEVRGVIWWTFAGAQVRSAEEFIYAVAAA